MDCHLWWACPVLSTVVSSWGFTSSWISSSKLDVGGVWLLSNTGLPLARLPCWCECWLLPWHALVFVQGLWLSSFDTRLFSDARASDFSAVRSAGMLGFGLPAPSQQVDHKLGSDVDIEFHSSCWSCGTSVVLLWLMASQKWSNKGYDGCVLTSWPSFCSTGVFLGNS